MKNAWTPLLVLVVLAGLACFNGCRQAAVDAAAQDAGPRTISVNVLTATATTIQRTTTQPATVHAYFETRVFAKMSGYLTDRNIELVEIGTAVKKGDQLAEIDVPEMAKRREVLLATIKKMKANEQRATAQLAVSAASELSYQAKQDKASAEVAKTDAALNASRIELDRVTDLVKKDAVAERLQDEAQKKHDTAVAEKNASLAAVKSAEAELKLARAQSDAEQADLDVARAATEVAERELDELDELIKYAQITAPIDGVVTQRNAEPGDLVRNSQSGFSKDEKPLFVVSQFDRVRVRVYVPERDVPETTVGDEVSITLQALPDEVFPGEIFRIAGVLDEQTRTMMVEIDIDNDDGRIRPGMFGQASITLAPANNSLMLPANAVRFDGKGKAYVYVVDADNKVSIAPIQTGLDDGAQIEITAGLNDSDQVVGPLLHRLKADQIVQVN
jgi:RND family efflux transporter MFP subunit